MFYCFHSYKTILFIQLRWEPKETLVFVERALISVYDKTGLAPFAEQLHELGIEIVSTGGTARALSEAGIPVVPVEEVTGFPEMMDGRVKTLHPLIHGALLARRNNAGDKTTCCDHNIWPFQMLVVNLYPFNRKVKENAPIGEIIENIDIGGPAMLRSAAKAFSWVTVVPGPEYYDEVLRALHENDNALVVGSQRNFNYAMAAFETTAAYDMAIHLWMNQLRRCNKELLQQYLNEVDAATEALEPFTMR